MKDTSRIILATLFGATLGGALGYLYLTEGGRRIRRQIEPHLDDFVQEVRRLRGTVDKARQVASEGWRSFADLMDEVPDGGDRAPTGSWPTAH